MESSIKKSKSRHNSFTILLIYGLFFIMLALWTALPLTLEEALKTNSTATIFLNFSFSILCLITTFGILNKNRYYGYLLGKLLILVILVYQGQIILMEPTNHPLLIFSFINLILLLLAFGKFLGSSFNGKTLHEDYIKT